MKTHFNVPGFEPLADFIPVTLESHTLLIRPDIAEMFNIKWGDEIPARLAFSLADFTRIDPWIHWVDVVAVHSSTQMGLALPLDKPVKRPETRLEITPEFVKMFHAILDAYPTISEKNRHEPPERKGKYDPNVLYFYQTYHPRSVGTWDVSFKGMTITVRHLGEYVLHTLAHNGLGSKFMHIYKSVLAQAPCPLVLSTPPTEGWPNDTLYLFHELGMVWAVFGALITNISVLGADLLQDVALKGKESQVVKLFPEKSMHLPNAID